MSYVRPDSRSMGPGTPSPIGADVVAHQLVDRHHELAGQSILRVRRGRTLGATDDLALARDDAGEDFRPAEIDAYGMRAVHPQPLP